MRERDSTPQRTLSALHEVAHWCIASAGRRRCRDYGYWYIPPPRDATAQTEFFAVEARVQALERRLVPEAIRLFAEGRLSIEGRKVRILR